MEGVAKSSGGGGCEVRRIHIIYFLSHMGRIEHPHLVRVHHLQRSGVYLRDVKRWLADLRGKDMPEAFAWSYRRRYKNGYVWQDLLDDDLITPISDNEYVLKGSQIIIPNTTPSSHFDPKRKSMSKEDDSPVRVVVEVEGMQPQQTSPIEETEEKPGDTKTGAVIAAPEIYEESQVFGSDRSTLTEDSTRPAIEKDSPERIDKFKNLSSSSIYASLLNKKTKKKGNSTNNYDSMSQNTSFLQKSSFRKSNKSNSMVASNMLRNFISCGPCGTVDTNDAVLVSTNRDNKAFFDQPLALSLLLLFFHAQQCLIVSSVLFSSLAQTDTNSVFANQNNQEMEILSQMWSLLGLLIVLQNILPSQFLSLLHSFYESLQDFISPYSYFEIPEFNGYCGVRQTLRLLPPPHPLSLKILQPNFLHSIS